jgi:hypothetical protein
MRVEAGLDLALDRNSMCLFLEDLIGEGEVGCDAFVDCHISRLA